jgi:hypothetical protein
MATVEERLKILRMIQDGKITAEEGAQLLSSLESGQAAGAETRRAANAARGPSRWFRVRVTDTDTGKTHVNLRLPVSLLHAGIKMGARFSPEVEGLDVNQLIETINSGAVGKVVDVFDDEDGEHVEIFIE